MIDYKVIVKSFNELSLKELYEIIRLRIDVFVVEQDCPYSDLDGKDYEAAHLFYQLEDESIIGYTRILNKGVSYKEVAIGRVIIHENYRHYKLGSQLMLDSIKAVHDMGETAIRLSAQEHLRGFYENLNFIKVSDTYLEDGIPHIEMLKA